MNKLIFVILLVFFVTGLYSCKSVQQKKESDIDTTKSTITNEKNEEAVNSAKEWLTYIDAGKYSESWDNAASLFQKAMPKDKWIETVNGFLPLYGKIMQRELISSKYFTRLPGAPEGEYVVIQFETSFENKKNITETITPTKDGGKWKVSGYYIK